MAGGSGGVQNRGRAPSVRRAPSGDRGRVTIRIVPGTRALFLGSSQSGKSTLAKAIASRMVRVFAVCDTDAGAVPNSSIVRTEREAERAIRAGASRISYVPDRAEYPIAERVDRLVELVLQRGGAWCFLFHEFGDVADERRIGNAIAFLFRAGAKLGHVTLACFQRTLGLPRIATQNATDVFLFAFFDPDDNVRAATLMGSRVRDDPMPLPFDYGYYHRGPDGRLSRVAGRR